MTRDEAYGIALEIIEKSTDGEPLPTKIQLRLVSALTDELLGAYAKGCVARVTDAGN